MERGEKEERKDDVDAAAEGGMTDDDGGYGEADKETTGVVKVVEVDVVKVVAGSEEEASAPLLGHPCSLLHLLLRACAGCLGLHGYCRNEDDDDRKPAADDGVAAAAAAAAAAQSPQEGDQLGGGDKAASYYLCTQEVVAQVRAARGPSSPGRPREGPGGGGGQHN